MNAITQSFNIAEFDEQGLSDLIQEASRNLKNKQDERRNAAITQIKDLADSIGVGVQITEANSAVKTRGIQKGSSLPVKYRDPDDPKNAWTGRGMKPRWLQAYLAADHKLEEFAV